MKIFNFNIPSSTRPFKNLNKSTAYKTGLFRKATKQTNTMTTTTTMKKVTRITTSKTKAMKKEQQRL